MEERKAGMSSLMRLAFALGRFHHHTATSRLWRNLEAVPPLRHINASSSALSICSLMPFCSGDNLLVEGSEARQSLPQLRAVARCTSPLSD